MPCYDSRDHDPAYICSGAIERAERAEAQLANEEKRSAWLTAALCLMTNPAVTCYATGDFKKYLSCITPDLWEEAGITEKDLTAWKKRHYAEDIKRQALEKLTPEERKALGH